MWNFDFLSEEISLISLLYYTIFEVADFKYNNGFQKQMIKFLKAHSKIPFSYGINKEVTRNDEPPFSFCLSYVWHFVISKLISSSYLFSGRLLMPVIYKFIEKVMIERESECLHDPFVMSFIQSGGQLHCSS